MKPGLEFEGKNIDSAIQKACDLLNVSRNKIKYDVLSNGSSGIFGLVGFKKARIRVVGPESELKSYTQREESQHAVSPASFQKVQSLVDEAFSGPPSRPKRTPPKPPIIEPVEIASLSKPSPPVDKPIEATTKPIVDPSPEIQRGKEALEYIIQEITTDAQIALEQQDERILYNVQGGNSAVLIGKRGQTLEAIQYIIDKIVNKDTEHRHRIQIDVEGYLESRKATLERLALRLADKTKRTGKPSTINQMNSHDRRIVHITLKEDKEVRTQSIGNGYYRKLLIFSKRQAKQKRKAPKKD